LNIFLSVVKYTYVGIVNRATCKIYINTLFYVLYLTYIFYKPLYSDKPRIFKVSYP